MSFRVARQSFVIGLAASLLMHVLAGVVLRAAAPESVIVDDDQVIEMDFDIEEPPEAPEAETPTDDPDAPMEDQAPDEDTADETPDEAQLEPVEDDLVPISPELEPEEALGDVVVDAGIADAGVPDMPDAGLPDAGLPDAGLPDAGLPDSGLSDGMVSDAGAVGMEVLDAAQVEDASTQLADVQVEADAAPAGDSGTPAVARVRDVAEDDPTLETDGGVVVAVQPMIGLPDPSITVSTISLTPGPSSSSPSGVIASKSTTPGAAGERRTPSQANLLAYAPGADQLVTALIRFDRLRGTEWSRRTEAILAPMPDYRSLVGGRPTSITSLFDTFVITSPNPRDVTVTTLLGHLAVTGARIRSYINHVRSPVSWTASRGGPLGRRKRSRWVARGDQRVFIMPSADWVVLTHPGNLGRLIRPTGGAVKDITTLPADRPAWMAKYQDIVLESGEGEGPALVFTIGRLLPPVWDAPYIGSVPTPERVTLALEVTKKGFFVRGTMLFADEKTAEAFVQTATQAQREFVETRVGKAVLSRFQAYNAVRGLSFAPNKAQVGFATSISVADGRAVMEFAARATHQAFGVPLAPGANKPRP